MKRESKFWTLLNHRNRSLDSNFQISEFGKWWRPLKQLKRSRVDVVLLNKFLTTHSGDQDSLDCYCYMSKGPAQDFIEDYSANTFTYSKVGCLDLMFEIIWNFRNKLNEISSVVRNSLSNLLATSVWKTWPDVEILPTIRLIDKTLPRLQTNVSTRFTPPSTRQDSV